MEAPQALELRDIAHRQDRKIREWLAQRMPTRFWIASYPFAGSSADFVRQAHADGFDNYPLISQPAEVRLFFFEQLLGARLRTDGAGSTDFFHTWCEPLVHEPDDVQHLAVEFDQHPAWLRLMAFARDQAAASGLPLGALPFSPLDAVCNLSGAERLFTWLHEAPATVERLLSLIADAYLEARRRLLTVAPRQVNPWGFPGLYVSDLQLGSLSAPMIERFVLPVYERVGQACGGLMLALNSPDAALAREVTQMPCVYGAAFDRRLPFTTIRELLGDRLFIVPSYAYDETSDRPFCRDGLWWNPIVQCHSRDVEEACRVVGRGRSMIIIIERPSRDEVRSERDRLRRLIS